MSIMGLNPIRMAFGRITINSKTWQQLFDAIMILGYRSRNGSNRKRGSKNSTKRVNQEIFRF